MEQAWDHGQVLCPPESIQRPKQRAHQLHLSHWGLLRYFPPGIVLGGMDIYSIPVSCKMNLFLSEHFKDKLQFDL